MDMKKYILELVGASSKNLIILIHTTKHHSQARGIRRLYIRGGGAGQRCGRR